MGSSSDTREDPPYRGADVLAHFWLNDCVNKQNCRIWSEANPQVYVETLLHPEKLTVWCALWAGGIIGPYFFKNDEGHNVTVNGDRYRAMITNSFIPELNNHDVQELWFQQDRATCHTACATIDLLKDTFGDRLISRFGPVNWPPRSCDLTPLDYFLWGYVKSLVYADKPQTLDHLEHNVRRVIADIRPQMLEKVIENWTSRLDYIRASRGSLMPEIIFKIRQEGDRRSSHANLRLQSPPREEDYDQQPDSNPGDVQTEMILPHATLLCGRDTYYIPQELISLFSEAPYRRYQLLRGILMPRFLPRGKHLSSDDEKLYLEIRFLPRTPKGIFTYRIIIRHGRCRFSASRQSANFGRGRTRNRPTT
ncbi:uncharacterized protein TNCV_4911021 [Trichonephila clavipes]|nr:uncharacterized protein TNCV_4911021 [Trichonephila clavipes]